MLMVRYLSLPRHVGSASASVSMRNFTYMLTGGYRPPLQALLSRVRMVYFPVIHFFQRRTSGRTFMYKQNQATAFSYTVKNVLPCGLIIKLIKIIRMFIKQKL